MMPPSLAIRVRRCDLDQREGENRRLASKFHRIPPSSALRVAIWLQKAKRPQQQQDLASAPDRIRTCDLRFRSALFAGISGLTKPDLVKVGSPRKGHIRRLGDKTRQSGPRIGTKGSVHRPGGECPFA